MHKKLNENSMRHGIHIFKNVFQLDSKCFFHNCLALILSHFDKLLKTQERSAESAVIPGLGETVYYNLMSHVLRIWKYL